MGVLFDDADGGFVVLEGADTRTASLITAKERDARGAAPVADAPAPAGR
ncbi:MULTISPECIES: hypothetical protein [unclassified Streptomyces]|nr:hypothetical protein [Streptomyces sp. MMBL 11-1]